MVHSDEKLALQILKVSKLGFASLQIGFAFGHRRIANARLIQKTR